jgi:hypothetical protein
MDLPNNTLFLDIIVVARESRADKVKHYISDVYKGKLNLDLSTVPDYMSGCEILIHIKDKIKVIKCTNFIIIIAYSIFLERFYYVA